MNVAKWPLFALLALPFLELAAFVAVAAAIGFGWALMLVFAGSLAGLLILRHAGGNHIARMRAALGEGSFTALQADSSGGLILLAGILLLIPGFITDVAALLLLVAPLRRAVGVALGSSASPDAQRRRGRSRAGTVASGPAPLIARSAQTQTRALRAHEPEKPARGLAQRVGTGISEKIMRMQTDSVLVPPSTLC